ncbi:MAG: ABC transporter substrate-binding protein [Candidatus Accumulibacter sp.]|jgi:iron complex transport system substrate-binding protein|nr:ABC transporter substrate-binding protein [Accumulibacter sp.]
MKNPAWLKCLVRLTVLTTLLGALAACQNDGQKPKQSFMNIGEFSVSRKSGHIEVRDGAGRRLALVPRGAKAPEGFGPTDVIEVPARRVIAYRAFEVGILAALGVPETLVGVTEPKEKWTRDDVRRGFEEGRIAYVGPSTAIDFERVKTQRPDVVMTWDPSIIPMMDSLGIPVVVTTTPIATCLNTHMRFVEFIAPFFGRENEGKAYFKKVAAALQDIRDRTRGLPKPRAMWGDIYEKRVLVEPGNAWVAELIGLAQSDYLFDDVYGASCIEISTERFIHSGKEADIYFTYRTARRGASSKAALARTNPLIAGIRPLGPEGRVYAPKPHYAQSADRLDEILTEISAILHPRAYPGHRMSFFVELPDVDPGG